MIICNGVNTFSLFAVLPAHFPLSSLARKLHVEQHKGKERMRAAVALAVVAVALLGCSVQSAFGFAVEVDAHAEECFFDNIKSGTKVGVNFQVAEGGFLDIDVKVSLCMFVHVCVCVCV